MVEYDDLSYEETLKVLREKDGKYVELSFHPSSKNHKKIELDLPNSTGDLEEELFGP